MSTGFTELYGYFRQEASIRCVSDHSSIILTTNPPSWGPSPFCFENMWLEHKSLKNNVFKCWNHDNSYGRLGYIFIRKLKGLKHKLHSWNKEGFGDLRVEKKTLEKRIQEFDNLEGSAS